jgi:hypothetical protein
MSMKTRENLQGDETQQHRQALAKAAVQGADPRRKAQGGRKSGRVNGEKKIV